MRSDLSALADGFRTGIWSLRWAFRIAPPWATAWVVLSLVVSLVPAAQVALVARLAAAHARGDGSFGPLALAVAAVVGGYLGIQAITTHVQAVVVQRFATGAYAQLTLKLARLAPADLADPDLARQTQASREVVSNGTLTLQAVSTVSSCFAVSVAVTLAAAVWQFNPGAALLILATLIPSLLVFARLAAHEAVQWDDLNQLFMAARYREEQLFYKRSAVELACLDAREQLAISAKGFREEVCRRDNAIEYQGIKLEALASGATTLILAGALLVLAATPNISALTIASALVGLISGLVAIRGVGFNVGMLLTGAPRVHSLQRFLDHPEPHPAADGPIDLGSGLSVHDLAVGYPERTTPVLNGVNIELRPGSTIALVGINGAGKTTLVNSLIGLLDPLAGSITIDGRDVTHTSFSERHPYFSLLSQEFGRYEFTVRENLQLAVPQRRVEDNELWAALRSAHADTFVRDVGGLDTQLGEQWGGTGMSGGQWQRLALARLFLRGAPIWILDEPTSAIDLETEHQIFRELAATASSRATILVSHRVSTLGDVDQIYLLDHGTIAAQGTFAELRRTSTQFNRLFALSSGASEVVDGEA